MIDNFDPDQLAWYTSEARSRARGHLDSPVQIGHVLLIVFVDTPIDSAVQRVTDKQVAQAIPEQHKAWERLTADVIAEYRHRGNFLEVRRSIAALLTVLDQRTLAGGRSLGAG